MKARRGTRLGRRPTAVEVEAAGKVNLGWHVGDLRDDGYHDVAGLVQTVSVTDRIRIEVTGEAGDEELPVDLTVAGPAATPELGGPDDLVMVAARRLAEEVPAPPTTITLHKRIPVAAGLGGGSADAAAALVGLAVAWGVSSGARDLLSMGADVSSDVPAIVHGGLVHVSGRGERVARAGELSGMRFVLGVSSSGLGAGDVYARLDELRAGGAEEPQPGLCVNDLEAAAIALEPDLARGLGTMREAGAVAAFVAGSGPTVVGVAPDPDDAQAVAERTGKAFVRTIVCEPVPWGVRVTLR